MTPVPLSPAPVAELTRAYAPGETREEARGDDSDEQFDDVAPILPGPALLEFQRGLLGTTFRVFLVAGAIAEVVALWAMYRLGELGSRGPLVLGLFVVAAAVGLAPRASARMRAAAMIASLVVLGCLVFYWYGHGANGRLFLLGAVVLAVLLVDLRWAIGLALATALAVAAVSLIPSRLPGFSVPFEEVRWWPLAASFGFIAVAVLGATSALLRRMVSSVNELQALAHSETEALRHAEADVRALEESRALVEALMRNSPSVMSLKNADGRYLAVNPEFERLFGHEAKLVLGRRDHELFPAELADLYRGHDEEVLRARAPLTFEERAPHGGETRTLLTIKFPVTDATGAVFAVGSISNDTTDLVAADTALREREARFRRIFRSSPDAMGLSRVADGVFVDVNDGFVRMVGWSRDEAIGKSPPELRIWARPEARATMIETIRRTGQIQDLEVVIRHRSGSERVCDMNGRIVQVDGQPHMLVVVRDVSVQRAAETELQRLDAEREAEVARRTSELAIVNRDLEAFSYTVSHDLRAPLRHVRGYLDLLAPALDANPDPEVVRLRGLIQGAADRMAELIEDLLRLALLGRAELVPVDVDLAVLAREVIAEVGDGDAPRAAPLSWDVGPLSVVRGDRTLLRQALYNLLDNAAKYTRRVASPRVELRGADRDGGYALTVRDNGAGFDMRYAERLFGVFQRLHRAAEFEGTGVGLAHVRRIVERHGGRVAAEGQVDAGATFTIWLPSGPTGMAASSSPLSLS